MHSEETSGTPKKAAMLPEVDPDRTPKLEDFGLSADFYKRWQKVPRPATPPPDVQPHAKPSSQPNTQPNTQPNAE